MWCFRQEGIVGTDRCHGPTGLGVPRQRDGLCERLRQVAIAEISRSRVGLEAPAGVGSDSVVHGYGVAA